MTYQLHHGDALEFMATLPDESVDAVITDPPYATTDLEWDKPVDWPTFWREAYRICKPSAAQVVFSAQPFTTDLIASNRRKYRYPLYWHKNQASGFAFAKTQPLRAIEEVHIFAKTGGTTFNPQKMRSRVEGRAFGRSNGTQGQGDHYGGLGGTGRNVLNEYVHPRNVLEIKCVPNGNGGRLHPTQKPVELMAWLVRTYTNPGDTILDPFAGSGSTGVAAIREGRRFIGCELDPNYHALAAKRLEAAAAQPRLLATS